MKIHIDINHPAHVHYFKNFIKIMESKGHKFVVTNRDSKIINQLLDAYGIEHIIRNKRPTNRNKFNTILYLLRAILWALKVEFKYKTDLSLSFSSVPCSFACWLRRKPSILLDDTEHNTLNRKLYMPFASTILTPKCFTLNIGEKQVRVDSFLEQLYLHSEVFKPNNDVIARLGVESGKYFVMRYISYDAWHDQKVKPLSMEFKKSLIKEIEKYCPVFVSLEGECTDDFFKPYILKINPEEMHDVLNNAYFLVAEGATMASEAAILGTPYVYINPIQSLSYINYQSEHYGEYFSTTVDESTVKNIVEQKLKELENSNVYNRRAIVDKIESTSINPTKLLVWFVENYPNSEKMIKENPEYQNRFK